MISLFLSLIAAKASSFDYAQSFGPLFQQAARWPVPEVVKLRQWLDDSQIPRVMPQFNRMYDEYVQPTLNLLLIRQHSTSRTEGQSFEQPGATNKTTRSRARPSMSEDEEPPRQIQRLVDEPTITRPVILQPLPFAATPSTAQSAPTSLISSVASIEQNRLSQQSVKFRQADAPSNAVTQQTSGQVRNAPLQTSMNKMVTSSLSDQIKQLPQQLARPTLTQPLTAQSQPSSDAPSFFTAGPSSTASVNQNGSANYTYSRCGCRTCIMQEAC